MFSFSASESIIAEFPDTKYTYFDQEEKKVSKRLDARAPRLAILFALDK